MKILGTMFLLLFSAIAFSGQTANNLAKTPKVEIIQQKWRVEFRNPALDEDPFRAVNERNQAERARRENMRENEIRLRQGKNAEPDRMRIRPDEKLPNGATTTYIYELKIKNAGQKEIRTVMWDYVFLDPETKKEVGRRRFISDTEIEPGKTKTLVIRTTIPPTETVTAARADKLRARYDEQTIIYTVVYADGTGWQAVLN